VTAMMRCLKISLELALLAALFGVPAVLILG
jgi:hypothetical protein